MTDTQRPERESFVSEPITPAENCFDTATMATGAPGVPLVFRWKSRDYRVAELLESWKTTSPCRSGGSEMYVRKHWYKVRTTTGETMTIYCNRQPPKGRSGAKNRWVLYSVASA